jgi:tRNA(fMet)-specific endonuclease VapC
MKYLLDTCTISYFVRGEKNVLARIKTTSPRELCISSIALMEIEYGLLLNPARAKTLKPVIQSFIENINIIQFGEKDAMCAASVRGFA